MSALLNAPEPPLATSRPNPLRVLLITQASGGGVGRHFLDLAQGLTAGGVRVAGIYSPRKVDAMFRERLQTEAVPPMHEFAMRRAVHPLDAVDLVGLIRLIKRLGTFDVIHGHSSKGGALARLAGRWLGIPVVYTPHALVTLDPTLRPLPRAFYSRIERWLAQSTAAMIAVSHDEMDHITEQRLRPALLRMVPNAIDPPPFPAREEARARLGLSPHHVAIGFVGRLAPQKAPDVMLAAFAEVARRHEHAQLIMVGTGPLADAVRAEVQRHGLEAKVQLLGDVVAVGVMPAFDVFCLSSRYEGLPYVLLESLAAGLPIVATRVGGVATTVEAEVNGLITPPDDVPGLAGALLRLVEDADLRRRFAAASVERAQQYSVQGMVRETIAVYRQVVSSTSRLRVAAE